MRILKLGLGVFVVLGFLVAAVALIGQNTEPLQISMFQYQSTPYPKWVVLLIAALIGAVLASLFFVIELLVLETRLVRMKRLNQKLERALSSSTEQHTAPSNGAGSAQTPIYSGSTPSRAPAEEDV